VFVASHFLRGILNITSVRSSDFRKLVAGDCCRCLLVLALGQIALSFQIANF
jgi:hypothetical protein